MFRDLREFLMFNSLYDLDKFDLKNLVIGLEQEEDVFRKYEGYREKLVINSVPYVSFKADISNRLWDWKVENPYRFEGKLSVFDSIWGKNEEKGFWSHMDLDYAISFPRIYKIAKDIYKDNLTELEKNQLLKENLTLCYTVGNLNLLPHRLTDKNITAYKVNYVPRALEKYPFFAVGFIDAVLLLIKKYTTEEMFKNYVDIFYWDDFVDENYNVIPLLPKIENIDVETESLVFPKTEEELNCYLEKVNTLLKLRNKRVINALKDSL